MQSAAIVILVAMTLSSAKTAPCCKCGVPNMTIKQIIDQGMVVARGKVVSGQASSSIDGVVHYVFQVSNAVNADLEGVVRINGGMVGCSTSLQVGSQAIVLLTSTASGSYHVNSCAQYGMGRQRAEWNAFFDLED